VSPSATPRK
jgi:hypothetical protein